MSSKSLFPIMLDNVDLCKSLFYTDMNIVGMKETLAISSSELVVFIKSMFKNTVWMSCWSCCFSTWSNESWNHFCCFCMCPGLYWGHLLWCYFFCGCWSSHHTLLLTAASLRSWLRSSFFYVHRSLVFSVQTGFLVFPLEGKHSMVR